MGLEVFKRGYIVPMVNICSYLWISFKDSSAIVATSALYFCALVARSDIVTCVFRFWFGNGCDIIVAQSYDFADFVHLNR